MCKRDAFLKYYVNHIEKNDLHIDYFHHFLPLLFTIFKHLHLFFIRFTLHNKKVSYNDYH